jgi:hypothetical protein
MIIIYYIIEELHHSYFYYLLMGESTFIVSFHFIFSFNYSIAYLLYLYCKLGY